MVMESTEGDNATPHPAKSAYQSVKKMALDFRNWPAYYYG